MKKLLLSLLFIIVIIPLTVFTANSNLLKGVIWQPTLDYNTPKGYWNLLGADTLLIQWMHLEKRAWIQNVNYPTWEPSPNWTEILSKPWAENIIFGLSCDFSLSKSRAECLYHRKVSIDIAKSIQKLHIPNPIHGWYAPIELDPSWKDNKKIADYIQGMPKPLYISSFVGKYEDPQKYADWVASWLPSDAHLLFQDCVGTGVLTIKESLEYINALIAKLGRERVNVILEAFIINKEKKLQTAPLPSIAKRLLLYKKLGVSSYLFSCRYLSIRDILQLKMYLLYLETNVSHNLMEDN